MVFLLSVSRSGPSALAVVITLLAATTCGGYKSGYKGRKWGYKGPKLGYK